MTLRTRIALGILVAIIALVAIDEPIEMLWPLEDEFTEAVLFEAAAGPAYVAAELAEHPTSEWEEVLEKARPRFGVPLTLTTSPPGELAKTFAGVELYLDEDFDVYLAAPVRDGTSVLLGPLPEPEINHLGLVVRIAAAVLFTMVATMIVTVPLLRRLQILERAMNAFASGKRDARAGLEGKDEVASVARHFDEMASTIEEQFEAQEYLLHSVAHELRTPAARIRFATALLQGDEHAEDRRERVAQIEQDVSEIDELVCELTDYLKLGRGPLRGAAPRDLGVLLDEAAEEADVVEAKESLVAIVEPRSFVRAISNLVRNARCYGERVEVRAWREEGQIVVDVEDDGPGIPLVDREQVLRPFVRMDPSRQRGTGGVGLGLAIVQRVVQAHGGSLCLEDGALGGLRVRTRWPEG
jgi:two-component system, OmpR family, sensor histidine kinase RstB